MVKIQVHPIAKFTLYLFLVLFTIFTITPLIWLFYSSFKSNPEIVSNVFALPKKIEFSNFTQAWKLGNLGIYFLNSIIYAVVTSIATVYIAMSIGYAFNAFSFRISKILYAFFLVGLLITAHAVLVPLFILESAVGIDDTRIGVLLPYIAFSLPFMIYLAYSFIRGLPVSFVEAAFIDGAGHFTVLHKIIFPISRPIIATMLIFTFLSTWNEFIFNFVLTSKESLRSFPVGINAFAGGMSRNFGLLFAALVIGIFPMLIFYALFYKRIVVGVAGGVLKE